jgi:hypothetical protein
MLELTVESSKRRNAAIDVDSHVRAPLISLNSHGTESDVRTAHGKLSSFDHGTGEGGTFMWRCEWDESGMQQPGMEKAHNWQVVITRGEAWSTYCVAEEFQIMLRCTPSVSKYKMF